MESSEIKKSNDTGSILKDVVMKYIDSVMFCILVILHICNNFYPSVSKTFKIQNFIGFYTTLYIITSVITRFIDISVLFYEKKESKFRRPNLIKYGVFSIATAISAFLVYYSYQIPPNTENASLKIAAISTFVFNIYDLISRSGNLTKQDCLFNLIYFLCISSAIVLNTYGKNYMTLIVLVAMICKICEIVLSRIQKKKENVLNVYFTAMSISFAVVTAGLIVYSCYKKIPYLIPVLAKAPTYVIFKKISFDRRRGIELRLNAEECINNQNTLEASKYEEYGIKILKPKNNILFIKDGRTTLEEPKININNESDSKKDSDVLKKVHEEPTPPLKEEKREEDGAKNLKQKNNTPLISQGGTTLEELTNNNNKESDLEEETIVVKEVEENIKKC
ncbi:hypothetical protein CWI38_0069p0050 [Hamiltosporidium tvaerminnensis]|uniref:Uncharacterized protein n=1 Tax=Hamiltosporidium tvaerminnensis TaxID=1176355 RepID=A0A4Q9M2N9_9MICR|nr:hypothetical protein CWI38_0069p0050 [Hamiltosporidium tvaerminnensis]